MVVDRSVGYRTDVIGPIRRDGARYVRYVRCVSPAEGVEQAANVVDRCVSCYVLHCWFVLTFDLSVLTQGHNCHIHTFIEYPHSIAAILDGGAEQWDICSDFEFWRNFIYNFCYASRV